MFKVPAYPLQEVFDPTGAGDAFAGGFMAHVARTGDLAFANLRRAMVYGSAMGSLAVEAFGVQRLEQITLQEVRGRVKAFRDLVHFELGDPPLRLLGGVELVGSAGTPLAAGAAAGASGAVA